MYTTFNCKKIKNFCFKNVNCTTATVISKISNSTIKCKLRKKLITCRRHGNLMGHRYSPKLESFYLRTGVVAPACHFFSCIFKLAACENSRVEKNEFQKLHGSWLVDGNGNWHAVNSYTRGLD